MAFETAQAKAQAVSRAANVIGTIKTIYDSIQRLDAARALYQAGTDPAFSAAFNALFDASERQELGIVIGQLNTLKADWEANHASLVG